MARIHLPGLDIQPDGTVEIRNDGDLDRLLRCPTHDLSSEIIVLDDRLWLDRDEDARASMAEFLNSARERLINEGRLPTPLFDLPGVGVRAESVVTSRKPGPECGYGVGTVTGHTWHSSNGGWNVDVTFDEPAGTWCGMPINGTSSGPDLVHVVGGGGRTWSTMTREEIDALLEDRRKGWA